MSKVLSKDADTFSVREDSNVVPIDFLVAEAGPSVGLGLLDEFIKRPADRGAEQKFTRARTIILGDAVGINRFEKVSLEKVTRVLRVMTVVTDNLIGGLTADVEAEEGHGGHMTGTVFFW